MKKQSKVPVLRTAPVEFWSITNSRIVHYTYLCVYPLMPNSYAVYLNNTTKLPERIYLDHIFPTQLNKHSVLKGLIESLENQLENAKADQFIETM